MNTFGIQISFERNWKGIRGILINYHMMCVMLVLVGSINFLIEPNVVPGRAGLLVTLFLVLTNFFSNAQVNKRYIVFSILQNTENEKKNCFFKFLMIQDEAAGFTALTVYVLACMIFIASAMLYYGLILFNLRKILKIEDARKTFMEKNDIHLTNSIIRWDRFMLIFFLFIFKLFNACYFFLYFFQKYAINLSYLFHFCHKLEKNNVES